MLHQSREENLKYIIIAGVVTGITVILSIIIVAIIFYVRRSDNQRRRGQTVCVQEQGDPRITEKQLWHSVPEDEVTAPSSDDKMNINNILKDNFEKRDGLSFNNGTDQDDSYFKMKTIDHFGGQQFFTFKKAALQLNEDLQSDTSGETTASDSGRGGSEEDIQPPPYPEPPEALGVTSFCSRGKRGDVPRRPRIVGKAHIIGQNGHPNRQYETYSPKILPSYALQNMDLNTLNPNDSGSSMDVRAKRSSFHEGHRRDSKKDKNGKRVTFQNDKGAQQKVRDWQCYNSDDTEPTIAFGYGNNSSIAKLNKDLLYNSYYHRYHDDDDNTTTSGSYSLEQIEMDDIMSGQYSVS